MLTGVDILHPVEVRVLGALLEKEITTPEYYPLTLNALVNACNQKSSREPIVNYDEDTVIDALETLKDKGMAVRISGAGHRVEKWGHRLGEKMNFGRRDLALLCVLMLRGPQTVGELRGRTERMHEFTDLEEVERCLEALSERTPDPLTTRMPRGRWMHLLGGAPVDAPEQPMQPMDDAGGRAGLADRVATLEREMEQLKQQFEGFRKQFE
jgi:uncharacterized protein